eukprot:518249-Prymnesium_polylepis.1
MVKLLGQLVQLAILHVLEELQLFVVVVDAAACARAVLDRAALRLLPADPLHVQVPLDQLDSVVLRPRRGFGAMNACTAQRPHITHSRLRSKGGGAAAMRWQHGCGDLAAVDACCAAAAAAAAVAVAARTFLPPIES